LRKLDIKRVTANGLNVEKAIGSDFSKSNV